MRGTIHKTGKRAIVCLPGSFANCTVVIEQVSETELRIRKVGAIPPDEPLYVEESNPPLSDRDRDLFLALLDNPPPPNEALRQLMDRGWQRRRKPPRSVQEPPADDEEEV